MQLGLTLKNEKSHNEKNQLKFIQALKQYIHIDKHVEACSKKAIISQKPQGKFYKHFNQTKIKHNQMYANERSLILIRK